MKIKVANLLSIVKVLLIVSCDIISLYQPYFTVCSMNTHRQKFEQPCVSGPQFGNNARHFLVCES